MSYCTGSMDMRKLSTTKNKGWKKKTEGPVGDQEEWTSWWHWWRLMICLNYLATKQVLFQIANILEEAINLCPVERPVDKVVLVQCCRISLLLSTTLLQIAAWQYKSHLDLNSKSPMYITTTFLRGFVTGSLTALTGLSF